MGRLCVSRSRGMASLIHTTCPGSAPDLQIVEYWLVQHVDRIKTTLTKPPPNIEAHASGVDRRPYTTLMTTELNFCPASTYHLP